MVREVPAATYAVLACPVAAIGPTKGCIFSEWRSKSGCQIDHSLPAFEKYPAASDTQSPVLIHIPIRATAAAAPSNSRDVAVVEAFVAAINAQDLAALSALMSNDHTFVDPEGHGTVGREVMLACWPRYFAMFPDYRIHVAQTIAQENMVVVLGSWSGTYAGQHGTAAENVVGGPAAWSAMVSEGKIKVWQVYADHTRTHEVVNRNPQALPHWPR